MRGAEPGRIDGEMESTYRFNTVDIGLKSIYVFHKRVTSKGYSIYFESSISPLLGLLLETPPKPPNLRSKTLP